MGGAKGVERHSDPFAVYDGLLLRPEPALFPVAGGGFNGVDDFFHLYVVAHPPSRARTVSLPEDMTEPEIEGIDAEAPGDTAHVRLECGDDLNDAEAPGGSRYETVRGDDFAVHTDVFKPIRPG
ncbi:MAG: hypothetical protein CSYNP_04422 [Syntrophus sp. SKADARSKE-3]|nr:hypothetical protein [Syntrophus sp. SKADARSKE-3]